MPKKQFILGDITCEKCKFWTRFSKENDNGKCRKNPPIYITGLDSQFPATKSTCFCGQAEPIEE